MDKELYKKLEEKYVIDRSYNSIFLHNFLSNVFAAAVGFLSQIATKYRNKAIY